MNLPHIKEFNKKIMIFFSVIQNRDKYSFKRSIVQIFYTSKLFNEYHLNTAKICRNEQSIDIAEAVSDHQRETFTNFPLHIIY